MTTYSLFTDGSAVLGNKGGIGIVFLKDGKYLCEYSKSFDKVTNNQMELAAIIVGMKAIKKPIDSLIIYTDSMYCIGCAILGWQRKKNLKLWDLFNKEYSRIVNLCGSVKFEHVKGHQSKRKPSDIAYWNNYVDHLAKQSYET